MMASSPVVLILGGCGVVMVALAIVLSFALLRPGLMGVRGARETRDD